MRLHALLMDRERRAYERTYGPVSPGELLRLLLGDEQFAWLRSLSGLMAQVDEVVDASEPVAAADAERLRRATYRLLKSDDGGVFHEKYREALQDSPDVVMAHAKITAALQPVRPDGT